MLVSSLIHFDDIKYKFIGEITPVNGKNSIVISSNILL